MKGWHAFYAIKKSIQIKIFQSVIEPIALYGSEVWGPLLNHEFEKGTKNPIKALHAEFCTEACRAELDQYLLLMRIEKRAIRFWKHLKMSDPNS